MNSFSLSALSKLSEKNAKTIRKRIGEINNKYFIEELLKLPTSNVRGNDAIKFFTDALNIDKNKLLQLAPQIPYIEEIRTQVIEFLLRHNHYLEMLGIFRSL